MKEPKLRFHGELDGEYSKWRNISLKEFATRVTRKNKGNESDIPLTISSTDGLVKQKEYFNKVIASTDMSNYYLLKKGEFAYNKSYSKGYPVGSIKRLTKYNEGVLSTLYICFSIDEENFNPAFISCYFDSSFWHNQVKKKCTEGARNHGLLNIGINDFFNTEHFLPTSMKEQQKIADFFSMIDEKIALKQKEYSALVGVKRGLLQKIFSQKIRFKGDNGREYPEWEYVPLNSFATRIKRKNIGNESDIPLTISSIDGLVDQRDYFKKVIASTDMSGYYLLKKGEFAYNKSYSKGYPVGSVKRLEKYDEGALSTLYICFSVNEKQFNPAFIAYYFDSSFWYEQVKERCTEGARNHGLLNIGVNDFFNTEHFLPISLEELKKIGFFAK